MMKKVIFAALFATSLASTSVFAMEDCGEYPYKKPVIIDNTSHAPSTLELYETGKIDTQKGLHCSRGIWQPELEFLDTDKAEWLTRDILFAIMDERKDSTFCRNGKSLQITNANCFLRDDLLPFYSYLRCKPLSKKHPSMVGWYFAGIKSDGGSIYFEIKVVNDKVINEVKEVNEIKAVKRSKTKKISWDDCNNPDFDRDLGIDIFKRKS